MPLYDLVDRRLKPRFCADSPSFTAADLRFAPFFHPFSDVRFHHRSLQLLAAARVTPPSFTPAHAKCAHLSSTFRFRRTSPSHLSVTCPIRASAHRDGRASPKRVVFLVSPRTCPRTRATTNARCLTQYRSTISRAYAGLRQRRNEKTHIRGCHDSVGFGVPHLCIHRCAKSARKPQVRIRNYATLKQGHFRVPRSGTPERAPSRAKHRNRATDLTQHLNRLHTYQIFSLTEIILRGCHVLCTRKAFVCPCDSADVPSTLWSTRTWHTARLNCAPYALNLRTPSPLRGKSIARKMAHSNFGQEGSLPLHLNCGSIRFAFRSRAGLHSAAS